jgi:hypothetical protein
VSTRARLHGGDAPQSPETRDGWTYRIEANIARRKGGDAWRGNLRELRNCILSSRLVTEARDGAPDTGQEPGSLVASSDRRAPASRRGRESAPPPVGDRMLEPDALTSGMSLDDWNRYVVTRMYVATGGNQSETARRLEISWRRAGMWIDHALLARWAAEGAPWGHGARGGRGKVPPGSARHARAEAGVSAGARCRALRPDGRRGSDVCESQTRARSWTRPPAMRGREARRGGRRRGGEEWQGSAVAATRRGVARWGALLPSALLRRPRLAVRSQHLGHRAGGHGLHDPLIQLRRILASINRRALLRRHREAAGPQ